MTSNPAASRAPADGYCARKMPLRWRPYCRIVGWPPILNTVLSSGKKNPVRLMPVVAGNEPPAAQQSWTDGNASIVMGMRTGRITRLELKPASSGFAQYPEICPFSVLLHHGNDGTVVALVRTHPWWTD